MQTMNTQEVAELLRVSRRRVVAIVRAGQLPSCKYGRDHAIPIDAALAFALRNRPAGRPKKDSLLA